MTNIFWDIVNWVFVIGSGYAAFLMFRDLAKFIRRKK